MSLLSASLDSVTTALAVVAPLVDPVPDAEDVTPGWVYAVLVLGLIVVTVLLYLSMKRRIGKIRIDDDRPTDRTDPNDPGQDPSNRPS